MKRKDRGKKEGKSKDLMEKQNRILMEKGCVT